jgi:outer membrane protein assembly factor BamB
MALPNLTVRRWGLAALLLAILLPSATADAVIPSAFGPIQALIVILPQLMLALAAGLVAIFKPRTYKLLGAYLWSHKPFTAVLVAGIGFLIWGPSFSSGKVTEEQVGAPWSAFRGGPARTGAVGGARGPLARPRVQWKLMGDPIGGATAAVDSSPAVVGNRVYFGVGSNSILGGRPKGAICCADTDTGALAWRWTGAKELDEVLFPVFSSPVVWVEAPEKGATAVARYLVCGEGYHADRDGRLVCLDLDPVRKSKGKDGPKLAWSLQATDHVESTPCIHEGKVFVGAGDDGYWGIELATGKVLWHIEGTCDRYDVTGPKVAELAALTGKTVAVRGVVKRTGAGAKNNDDAGTMSIEAAEIREMAAAPVPLMESGRTLERTVFGRVTKGDKGPYIAIDFFNPDSESSCIAVTTANKEQRVLFGSGVGGQRVNCVNAETGALVWKTSVPYPAFGAPTVAGDKVLIGVGKGNFVQSDPDPVGVILCLALKDGAKIWEQKLPDTVLGSVIVVDGRAYAGSRDGNIYVLDAEKGTMLPKYSTGSPIVSSPAVTADSIYACNDGGRLFCFDRKSGSLRFTTPVTPGSPIVSSPAVTAGKLFLGTRSKGLLCFSEAPKEGETKIARMSDEDRAGRTGCADDRGLPAIAGDTADLKWPQADALKTIVPGPIYVDGPYLLVPGPKGILKVDSASGRVTDTLPAREPGESASSSIHGMTFKTGASNDPNKSMITCTTTQGRPLWTTTLDSLALGPTTVAGDKVFVVVTGRDQAKALLEAHKLVDGSLAWRQPLNDLPVSFVVASTDWACVATADDKIAVFKASDGKPREPLVVDGKAATPALCGDVVIVVGEKRLAAHDLASSDWPWNFKDDKNIGMVTGQPVILGETIWVPTSGLGLVAIGTPSTQAKK